MKFEEMLILDLFLEKFIKEDYKLNVADYKLIINLNNKLYKASFLEKIKGQKGILNFNEKLWENFVEEYTVTSKPTRLNQSLYKDNSTRSRGLFTDFIDYLQSDFDEQSVRFEYIKEIVNHPNLILSKLSSFVTEKDVTKYLNKEIEITPVVYDLESLDNETKLDFYLLNNQVDMLSIVSLELSYKE
ncbi:hypothetical protein P7H55_09710 [Vagococcus lutrae]|uniref:hypothetical protein n=1 Tax=Vagococcus lutrae TaxID=81947 RepID=UPI0028926B27|nr:hypothetical protein [Vagococcus lutrae]MDT2818110.1 hypothetical protein [Vagococcus lutrae]